MSEFPTCCFLYDGSPVKPGMTVEIADRVSHDEKWSDDSEGAGDDEDRPSLPVPTGNLKYERSRP